jgi:hypothetical protein
MADGAKDDNFGIPLLELLFSRALYMPDKHSTMELYPNSLFLEF